MANGRFQDVLKNGGFQAFLWTQFLGAFNDNAYRIIVSLRAVHIVARADQSGRYLALAGAIFVLPSLLFTGYAGHLADAISKRKVLIGVKVFEIAVMSTGIVVFLTQSVAWMFVVLLLMAVHYTVFSPAKYSIVPELVPDRDLSRANALLEMSTLVAIVLGTSIGPFLLTAWQTAEWKIGVVLTTIAVAGCLASFRITRVPAAGASQPFRLNPFAEVADGTKHLLRDRPLWLAVMAISYFWFLGLLFQMDLVLFGSETLQVSDRLVGLLMTCLSLGIGAGSMLAGRLSGDKVEIGLVPLGAIFMGVFSLGLYGVGASYAAAVVMLALLGIAAGVFFVPLNAYLQQRSESREKGRIIATNNIYNTLGMLLATAVFYGCHDGLRMSPPHIILLFGLVSLLIAVYIVTVVDDFLIRFVLWFLTHTIFRIRIVGHENVPFRGPALLVANHMSHVDGFLVGACVQRFIRFMVWKPYYELKAFNWFLRKMNAIPVGGGRAAVQAVRAARRELAAGHVVCIFAEGAVSRTGNILPFKRGLETIMDGAESGPVPIIPVHLDRLWGSIFSFERGRFFWKWPKRVPYPVTVSFGAPMPANSSAQAVRQAIQELGAEAAAHRKTSADTLPRRLVRSARRNWSSFAMADSTGRELTYGRMLTASLLLAKWARTRHGEEMMGVLLPPSVAGALVNVGITLAGRVPVNLNFTAGPEAMAAARERCAIRTVVTSRVFLAKAKIEAPPDMLFVEDIVAQASTAARWRALLAARLMPARMLCGAARPDALATVIFSSGSTGVPKGVMLSHYNVIANIDAMAQVFWVGERDRIVGVLPFFHSFGYTVTIWFPLLTGCGAVYHPNPTDAKSVGELIARHRATFLLSTPTFCSAYARKCAKEDFASLRFVLVGAEKLREPVATAFQEKFGIALLEGYGCTEMAPVVAVNGPDFRAGQDSQTGNKPGTVGQPLPGVAAQVVDPATFAPLGANQPGLLLVKGANRMTGYLGEPQRTADALHDGWYITGDVASIDDEGFIRLTDRLSRFSKIAGEMVPHLRIEDAIAAVLGAAPCAVTSIADDRRGERLAALYLHEMEPAELWQKLSETDLPRLWIPKRENLYRVESLPQLGTGKLDLRGLKMRAEELAAEVTASRF
ncbi:MAG TPA: acyl-[ACP]--phospholipid O-acyltransferase [Bryobacteraceae bacterium]|nr:acyl-[ACP]--phospholipid O-acyltransferase [Bryobacteraceae bacterium]